MATNPFFNQFNNVREQTLYEDLVVESIKIFGHDMYYLPRLPIKQDKVMNEYSYSIYEKALPVEIYIKNFDNFEGEGQFLSKFGLEIRDKMTLVMSNRAFFEHVKPHVDHERPAEGDCIYIPVMKRIFQINYVDTSALFYGLGKLTTFEMTCDLLEFSNEQFRTGISEIDELCPPFQHADQLGYDLESYDNGAANKAIQNSADQVLSFEELDPFEGSY